MATTLAPRAARAFAFPSPARADGTARAAATALVVALHDELTALFTALDGGGAFAEERWERPGGGGGVSRALTEGTTFEKAGVNRSAVDGTLPRAVAARLGATVPGEGDATFFATGVSLVVHPRSPMIPTVHLNVRYFEIADADGTPLDAWVGGGADLTPTYPFPEDARDFHRALRRACAPHGASVYPAFKRACDDYFTNGHREGEARGVGGIFFDHLRPAPGAPAGDGGFAEPFALLRHVGRSLRHAYAPIVERRRAAPYGAVERDFQLERRGRYVEFNLLHDRGTLFGLQTGARVESVLMSLPPMASWGRGARAYAAGSFQSRLLRMLVPRDWTGDGA